MKFKQWLLERSMTFSEALNILGVTEEQIKDKTFLKKHWKKLAMQNHPDRGGDMETMQKINVAYDILKVEGSSSGSSYTSYDRQKEKGREDAQRKREQYQQERKEREKKHKDTMAILKKQLNDKFQPLAYQSFFSMCFGGQFEKDTKISDDLYGILIENKFTSTDNRIEINFDFSVLVTDKEKIKNQDYKISVWATILIDKKLNKIGRKNIEDFDMNVLFNPELVFKKAKMKALKKQLDGIEPKSRGGKTKPKTNKLSKAKMIAFIHSKLTTRSHIRGSEATFWIDLTDSAQLVLYRMTMRRQVIWVFNGIYQANKRVAVGPNIVMPETTDTADFLLNLVYKLNKAKGIDKKELVFNKMAQDYKDILAKTKESK